VPWYSISVPPKKKQAIQRYFTNQKQQEMPNKNKTIQKCVGTIGKNSENRDPETNESIHLSIVSASLVDVKYAKENH